MVTNAYRVVFLFCCSSSWGPYVVSFSGLSILISPYVFFNVYSSTTNILKFNIKFAKGNLTFNQPQIRCKQQARLVLRIGQQSNMRIIKH